MMIFRPLWAFVPPASEGYVRNRKEVAGFEPHGREDYLQPVIEVSQGFKVVRLDLVSLLLHETPMAYDSETLPSMEEIKHLKTRPLDAFEQYGLAVLRGGEDLFAREDGKRVRLIGALRN